MKTKTQLIAAALLAACAGWTTPTIAGPYMGPYGPFGSAGAYGGFGPYTQEVVRPLPVGERIVTRTTLIKEQPMVVGELVTKRTTRICSERLMPVRELVTKTTVIKSEPSYRTASYDTASSNGWSAVAAPFNWAGNLVTSPFRSSVGPEPVAEKVIIARDSSCLRRSAYRQHILRPVGERIVTVKTMRVEPVAERITTVKTMRVEPVAERITTVKTVRLMPVRERLVTVKTMRVEPVRERIITRRVIRLAPVGEQIITPEASCGFYGNPYW